MKNFRLLFVPLLVLAILFASVSCKSDPGTTSDETKVDPYKDVYTLKVSFNSTDTGYHGDGLYPYYLLAKDKTEATVKKTDFTVTALDFFGNKVNCDATYEITLMNATTNKTDSASMTIKRGEYATIKAKLVSSNSESKNITGEISFKVVGIGDILNDKELTLHTHFLKNTAPFSSFYDLMGGSPRYIGEDGSVISGSAYGEDSTNLDNAYVKIEFTDGTAEVIDFFNYEFYDAKGNEKSISLYSGIVGGEPLTAKATIHTVADLKKDRMVPSSSGKKTYSTSDTYETIMKDINKGQGIKLYLEGSYHPVGIVLVGDYQGNLLSGTTVSIYKEGADGTDTAVTGLVSTSTFEAGTYDVQYKFTLNGETLTSTYKLGTRYVAAARFVVK